MIRDIPGHVAVFFITVYQRTLSPDTGFLRYAGFSRGGVCRFNPTCSEYTKNTILSHGLIKGVFLGARQLSQCHPWHQEKIENKHHKNTENTENTRPLRPAAAGLRGLNTKAQKQRVLVF